MKRSLRILCLAMALLLCGGLLAACSDGPTESGAESSADNTSGTTSESLAGELTVSPPACCVIHTSIARQGGSRHTVQPRCLPFPRIPSSTSKKETPCNAGRLHSFIYCF